MDALDQLERYVEWARRDPYLGGNVRGILVAQVVPPQVVNEAWRRGLKTAVVDYDELRGLRPEDLTLF